jgi:hypothetical protein
MEKDSRNEDKKRYNAPYLRAFDYLAKEMRVTQGKLVEMMKGNSSFISAYRSGTKRVGFDYMKRLCEVFSIYFKGERHLNMRYLEGTSQYMLVENIPDEEIHEIMQRDGDPDYDVIKQRNQKEVQPISYSYKDEYIETLKSQMEDLRIQLNDNMKRLDEKDEYIAILKRENERLLNENERLLIALSESQPDELLRKFPFHMGSAEQGLSEQPKI